MRIVPRFSFFLVPLSLVPFFLLPLSASAECFSRDLRIGMEGSDIVVLQKILNRRPETQVAKTGPGSPGAETAYFGALTKQAVIKFQEYFRDKTLVPTGLKNGTGYVGPLTRKILEEECSPMESPIAQTVVHISSGTSSNPIPLEPPMVMYPSKYSGIPGEYIYIYGAHFALTENSIFLGEYEFPNHRRVQPGVIAFQVPNTIPYGKYSLQVVHRGGKSDPEQFFVVRNPSVPEPVIASLSPETIAPGETVTLHGTGFALTENEVIGGHALIKDVLSSDEKTLSFPVQGSIFHGMEGYTGASMHLPLWIYVVNDRGVSNPIVLTVKI